MTYDVFGGKSGLAQLQLMV